MKKANNVLIRSYKEDDAPFLAAIYFNTIHIINAKDYSLEQVNAWAPTSSLDAEDWRKKWRRIPPIIATLDQKVVGFVEFEENGHIDCFYCHHEYQGCGVGTALMKAVENKAYKLNINRIYSEVSITAKPFFEAKGFSVVKEQSVNLRGVVLTNFIMEKLNVSLPYIDSYEEYDRLNLNNPIFRNAAREIIARHHLSDELLSLLLGTNVVFLHGKNRIIKIFPPAHQSHFTNEVIVMKHLYNKLSVITPAIEYEGTISGWPYIIMSRVEGTLLERLWETLTHNNKVIIIRELGALIREVHALPTQGLESIDCHWQKFISKQIVQCVSQHQSTQLPDKLVGDIPKYLEYVKEFLPQIKNPVILTGEYTPMNFLVTQKSDIWHINGLIDFGDSMLGLPQYDLLGPGAFLIQGDKVLLREFLLSYGYSPDDLTEALSRQLTLLMLLHRYSNLNIQIRIENWKEKVANIKDIEKLVWGF